MKRHIAEHFTEKGRPKQAYDEPAAKRAAEASRMYAYQCSFCGRWHIGGHRNRRHMV